VSPPQSEERERLEAERDFLLKSLDDLENERAAGGIDDESYTQLHDDYTARAAATIRALRDGVDARPIPERVPWTRRAIAWGGIAVLAAGSGVALASALGGRGPGETSSGNAQSMSNGPNEQDERRQLEAAVEADPSNIGNRLLLARYLEQDDELAAALEQYDAVLALERDNVEALAQSGRVLYLGAVAAPQQAFDLVDEARVRLDRAIELDAEYPDARFFRAIILANEFQDFVGAQTDLQQYLVLAPEGLFAQQARALLAEVTAALEPRVTTTT
jgi:tetratricopeptide (TPR) repeat protein